VSGSATDDSGVAAVYGDDPRLVPLIGKVTKNEVRAEVAAARGAVERTW
jgi:hypothetical protein